MEPEQVNVVRAEPLQAAFHRVPEIFAMVARRVRVACIGRGHGIVGEAELRCQDKPVPVTADEFPGNRFAAAIGVEIGGVNKIAARRRECLKDCPAFIFGCPPSSVFAERHGSQTQFRHPQAAPAE